MSPSIDFSFCGIFSDTRRIVSAHSSHFLALSAIFLLPLYLLAAVELFVQTRLPYNTTPYFLFLLISSLFSIVLSLCAVGSITHSVTNAFFGRPVKLAASLSSLLRSFLPLLLTSLASMLIYFAICFIATLGFAIGILIFHFLVSEINYTSLYFILACGLAIVAVLICGIYFQVNWAVARAVVVVENTRGFEPLKRSSKLVQGKKLVVLCYLLFFGLGNGLLTWLSLANINAGDGPWKKPVQFVILTVLMTALRLMVAFCSLAVEPVMYLHCKAVNGELAGGIGKEFGGEYVTLPAEEEA